MDSLPISQVLSYFLALEDAAGSSCKFSVPALESAISSGSLGSFYWGMVLETKIWMLGVLVAVGVSFAPRPSLHTDRARISMCMY